MKKLIKIAAVIFALCVFSACARKIKTGILSSLPTETAWPPLKIYDCKQPAICATIKIKNR